MPDRYKTVMKIGAIIVPVVVAILSGIYGDVGPMARDFCSMLLPAGSIVPRFPLPQPRSGMAKPDTVDAGAPR